MAECLKIKTLGHSLKIQNSSPLDLSKERGEGNIGCVDIILLTI